MPVYEQMDEGEKSFVDKLFDTCAPLSWRERHLVFNHIAETAYERLCREADPQQAEDRLNEAMSLTIAAVLEKFALEACADGWCAVHLMFSARADHRDMGKRWAAEHEAEWHAVLNEISAAIGANAAHASSGH